MSAYLPKDGVFVIAEAGVNHNGDVDLARRLVELAADAGADAVKFQTFRADRTVSKFAPKAAYQLQTTDVSESQYEMLKRLELSDKAHYVLMEQCRERGIRFLSTPFDEQSADFLVALGIQALKIPSGEITNRPFLEHVAKFGKPVILSSGMADLTEVGEALSWLRNAGSEDVTVLHCLSNYPADPAETNLRAMQTIAATYDVSVGYSDHTPGIEISLAAVALGARVIEKHFTLDQELPGPDHKASLSPKELKALIRGIRSVSSALGNGVKQAAPSELENRTIIRRSLVALTDISSGATITRDMVGILRPATGLPPSRLGDVLNRRSLRAIPAGTPITADMVENVRG